jgi:two-component system nitrogen regulation sensor histidine kinase NtrY
VAQSQQTLVERRRYLETILQNIGTGVISTDGHGHVRTVNAAAGRILGVPPAEILGRTAAELVDAGKAPEIFSLLGVGPGAERFVSDEVEMARGERKATIKYMRTRLEHEGAYRGTVFVFEDLTELIQSKKLSAWVEMARQIAHEIKNPLTPIRISTQFMQRAYEQKASQFDRIFHEGTETIMQQVDVLKRIASEFSSYGRMQQLRVESCPLDPMIRTIVAPYERNESGVVVHYDNGVADARVMVDPEAVRKICSNLIENALEAMPDGGDLRVACEEVSDNGGRMVRVSFRDTGPGLSDDVAERLFEPYFSTKTTGTGLGLAICRTLSQEMGGDVTVRNVRDGRGVEAVLTLRRDAKG